MLSHSDKELHQSAEMGRKEEEKPGIQSQNKIREQTLWILSAGHNQSFSHVNLRRINMKSFRIRKVLIPHL